MELDRGHLHGPDHAAELGHAELIRRPSKAGEVDLHGLHPVRGALRQPLLVHLVAVDPLREPVQHARPLAQAPDDPVADAHVVPGQVELGLAARGEVHPVRAGDPNGSPIDLEFDAVGGGHAHRQVRPAPRPDLIETTTAATLAPPARRCGALPPSARATRRPCARRRRTAARPASGAPRCRSGASPNAPSRPPAPSDHRPRWRAPRRPRRGRGRGEVAAATPTTGLAHAESRASRALPGEPANAATNGTGSPSGRQLRVAPVTLGHGQRLARRRRTCSERRTASRPGRSGPPAFSGGSGGSKPIASTTEAGNGDHSGVGDRLPPVPGDGHATVAPHDPRHRRGQTNRTAEPRGEPARDAVVAAPHRVRVEITERRRPLRQRAGIEVVAPVPAADLDARDDRLAHSRFQPRSTERLRHRGATGGRRRLTRSAPSRSPPPRPRPGARHPSAHARRTGFLCAPAPARGVPPPPSRSCRGAG